MSYSDYVKKRRSGIYIGPTKGRAVPTRGNRGCLCKDRDVYSEECCNGYMINQGIGKTEK